MQSTFKVGETVRRIGRPEAGTVAAVNEATGRVTVRYAHEQGQITVGNYDADCVEKVVEEKAEARSQKPEAAAKPKTTTKDILPAT